MEHSKEGNAAPDAPSDGPPDTAGPARQAGAPAVGSARSPKVLLVDPDADVLNSTGLLIEALGYDVVRLGSAEEILETVLREQPGLILQETQMPGLNIAGLLAALRSDPTTAGVRVALFSAVLDLAQTAQRHQAWGHLAKPFGHQELAHLLERALGPPPGVAALDLSKDVEKEIRLAFREYRNLLAALNNYVVLLEKGADLAPSARATVERLQDLILMMEARTVRLRAYILSLVGPASPAPTPPTFDRPSRASRPASGATVHGRLGKRVDVASR